MRPPIALPRGLRNRALYPDHYVWYVFAATLDIVVTYVIVWGLGGRELNRVAWSLVERFDHWGLIGLKFASVIVVVLICETVGRRNERWGRRLAVAAVVLSALPVGVGILQVLAWLHLGWFEPPTGAP